MERLRREIQLRLRRNSEADCIVGISGGKDSSFAVWAMKEFFGLRVEAFTYDHDGVSPQARENARAVCAALGVPLTVVALPGHAHRKSFRDYFLAWLEHPSPVTAGLMCVACKHLHVLGTALAARRGAPMIVWAKCPLEDSPFLALQQRGNGQGRQGLLRGGFLLAAEALASPGLRRAIVRQFSLTLQGCLAFQLGSRYLALRRPSVKQIAFFDYWPWNPAEIYRNLTAIGWRRPEGVPSDWHSDCVFNVFKEYCFQSMFGASYTDGFLSNQIRHGLLSRAEALRQLAESKRRFGADWNVSLHTTGCADLAARTDPSCFAAVGL